MSTLSDAARATLCGGAVWKYCGRCDVLFPGIPGRDRCRHCDTVAVEAPQVLVAAPVAAAGRCLAAHPEDTSACDGPADAVLLVDQLDDELTGCVHHAARVLASVEGAQAYPGSVAGADLDAVTRSESLPLFEFDPVTGWPGAARVDAVGGY